MQIPLAEHGMEISYILVDVIGRRIEYQRGLDVFKWRQKRKSVLILSRQKSYKCKYRLTYAA